MTLLILSGLFHGALFALAGYLLWLAVRRRVMLLILALILRSQKTEDYHGSGMKNGWSVPIPEIDLFKPVGWLCLITLIPGFAFALAVIVETSARVSAVTAVMGGATHEGPSGERETSRLSGQRQLEAIPMMHRSKVWKCSRTRRRMAQQGHAVDDIKRSGSLRSSMGNTGGN